jgi:predicted nucleic acid-binding protein
VILADTSVWVQHFRGGCSDFAVALRNHNVSMHPVVLGELATGNLARRRETLADLRRLPRAVSGTVEESLGFIETHRLFGRGIGWNDVQLLVAAQLSRHWLWSLDARLASVAERLKIAYRP